MILTLGLSLLALSAPQSPVQFPAQPDGEQPAPIEVEVGSQDAGWFAHLLGPPRVAVAASANFGTQRIPTSEGPEGDVASDLQFTVDGSQYLIAHRDSQNVLVFDAATRNFVTEIALSGSPLALAVSPDGVWAATANGFEGTVSMIDLASGMETAVITVGNVPSTLDFTPNSQRLAVGNFADDTLEIIDVAAGTTPTTFFVGSLVGMLSFNFESSTANFASNRVVCVDNDTVAVPLYFSSSIAFCSLSSGTINFVATPANPRVLAFEPSVDRLVASHMNTVRFVSVFDTAAQVITNIWSTAANLTGPIAISGDGAKSVLGIQNSAFVMDLNTGAIGASLNTATVAGFLTTADGAHALGIGYSGALINYASGALVSRLNDVQSCNVGGVSPVTDMGAMAGSLFGEQQIVVSTNGAAGTLLDVLTSGVTPEADAPRRLVLSADGTRAVVTNVLSGNASVLDLSAGALLGVVEVGQRPSGVAITPDGSKAVVANLDSTFATIIDLATLVPTNVPISTRGAEVQISNDGQYAYISVVSGGDGVWRIDLSTGTVAGAKLLTGNMGGAGGVYNQSSGLTLSPSGVTLIACGSFDDTITLIDTVSWTIRATVPAAAFPVRAIFLPGTVRFLVVARNSQELIGYDLTGSSAVEVGRVALGFQPFECVVDAAGTSAFCADVAGDRVHRIDLTTFLASGSVVLPGTPVDLAYDNAQGVVEVLLGDYAASVGGAIGFAIAESGEWLRVDAGSLAVLGATDVGASCSDLGSSTGRLAACAIRRDYVVSSLRLASLTVDTNEISVSAGGAQNLALNAGPANAGKVYFVAGSAHGTSPGFLFGGTVIPLVFDGYMLNTINFANQGSYVNTLGVLDANGCANASLVMPAGASAALAGIGVDHAFIVFDPGFPTVGLASNPVSLGLLP